MRRQHRRTYIRRTLTPPAFLLAEKEKKALYKHQPPKNHEKFFGPSKHHKPKFL